MIQQKPFSMSNLSVYLIHWKKKKVSGTPTPPHCLLFFCTLTIWIIQHSWLIHSINKHKSQQLLCKRSSKHFLLQLPLQSTLLCLIGILAPSVIWSGSRFKSTISPVTVCSGYCYSRHRETWKSCRDLCQQGQGDVSKTRWELNTNWSFPALPLAWKKQKKKEM